MNTTTTLHSPRYIDERRDDDVPCPPWPWIEPDSGQARRAGGVILGAGPRGNQAPQG